MAIIFSSGIETEVDAFTTEFDSKSEGSSNTLVTSATAAYVNSGSKGARADIDYTDSASGAYAIKGISDNTEHWFRGYVKFDANLEYGTAFTTVSAFTMRDGSSALWYIYCRADAALNTFHWQVRVRYSTGSYLTLYQGSVDTLTLDQWHYVEIHWKAGTGADGGAEFKLNGTSMASDFTRDCSSYAADTLRCGADFTTTTFAANTGLAFDDVALDDAGWLGPVTDGVEVTPNLMTMSMFMQTPIVLDKVPWDMGPFIYGADSGGIDVHPDPMAMSMQMHNPVVSAVDVPTTIVPKVMTMDMRMLNPTVKGYGPFGLNEGSFLVSIYLKIRCRWNR